MNFFNKTITKREAYQLNMTIWNSNDDKIKYARLPQGINRDHLLYGYVFTII